MSSDDEERTLKKQPREAEKTGAPQAPCVGSSVQKPANCGTGDNVCRSCTLPCRSCDMPADKRSRSSRHKEKKEKRDKRDKRDRSRAGRSAEPRQANTPVQPAQQAEEGASKRRGSGEEGTRSGRVAAAHVPEAPDR